MKELPKVISTGKIKIGNMELRVHNLDDGRRVIEAEDMAKLFMGDIGKVTDEQAKELAKAIKAL